MSSNWHKAIGRADGDTLTLSNQWSKVIIEQCFDDDADTIDFRVTGDTDTMRFSQLSDAVSHALSQLAKYEEGRLF